MKLTRMKQLILGAVAAAALIPSLLTTKADAQTWVARKQRPVVIYQTYNPLWYRYYDPFYSPYYDPFWSGSYWGPTYRSVDPIAYQKELGYSEGRGEGKEDAKKGRPANPTGHKDYLKSNSLAFRQAFVQGYNERYREEVAKIKEKARERNAD